ncbi:hypothetical protein M409DRAFT_48409 [Zasmidium cellare ATCC 36951]|uniref:Uncharacterized protein n=1 Tax=Zasmidium cellare ATCC 36951 TaxID=1080233 RepID=A0A6A6D4Y2_ZASCE|nr:uncharacterized protein M409DRAFT_48409 [Zasmidium cellare ATCC 36951]KAF2173430.1 hypothetical protein M409DRAFT_48409 [Zasmidium cellare ATCC 36951]
MSTTIPDKDYLNKVCEGLPPDHPLRNITTNAQPQRQKVLYTCLNGSTIASPSLPQLLQQHTETEARNQIAVCLVENICHEWVAALGTAWNIDHTFFFGHASNPIGESVWEALMNPGGKWEDWTPNRSDPTIHHMGHLHGFFEHLGEDSPRPQIDRFPRRLQRHPRWGLQGNSKISYCRVSPCLYLILTDLPLRKSTDVQLRDNPLHTHLCFRVPFSRNYGGLAIPQEYDRPEFSALDIFVNFLNHAWHWRILFAEHLQNGAVHPMILSNFLAASMWRTNFLSLKQNIQSIAFRDVRRPSILINDRLHDARQALAGLQAEVQSARKWMLTEDLDDFLKHIRKAQPTSPHAALDQVLEEAEHLYQFLMDTFQLLMGSISVLDSQTSLEEAKRSTTLTQLAAVYLPLSLATSIFGMNIKEINESPLSVWVVFVALAILAVGTVLLLLGATAVRAVSLGRMRQWAKNLHRSKKKSSPKNDAAVEEQAVEQTKYG